MIEYKTQKKERYYSEVIRLYTELGYSIGHISRIFPLSYGIVKRWLSIFAEEERKDNESFIQNWVTVLGISPEYFHSVMVLLSAGCLSLQKKNAKIMNQP